MSRNARFFLIVLIVVVWMIGMLYLADHLKSGFSSKEVITAENLKVVVRVDTDSLAPFEQRATRVRTQELIEERAERLGLWLGERTTERRDWFSFVLYGSVDCDWVKETLLKQGKMEIRELSDVGVTNALVSGLDKISKRVHWGQSVEQDRDSTSVSDTLADTSESGKMTFRDYLLDRDDHFEIRDTAIEDLREFLKLPEVREALGDSVEVLLSGRSYYRDMRLVWLLVFCKPHAVLSGDDFVEVTPGYDDHDRPVLEYKLNDEGAAIMADLTTANVGKVVAVVSDGEILSVPIVKTVLGSTGRFSLLDGSSYRDAEEMAALLSSGPLPAPVEVIDCRGVFERPNSTSPKSQ